MPLRPFLKAAARWRRIVAALVLLPLAGPALRAQSTEPSWSAVQFPSRGATLAGRIYLPARGRRVPGVVLVHGSGPDEASAYAAMAEQFARAGVAAIVYDKRGAGLSTGDWMQRRFDLLAADARAAMARLAREPRVDSLAVGLWGVSQGGWVLSVAASQAPAPAFVIAVSANGVSPEQQELWHKENMLRALGYSPKARDIGLTYWRLALDFIERAARGEIPLPASMLTAERAGASVGMRYDPLPAWKHVTAPVLLIFGGRDELTPADEAQRLITTALHAGGNDAVRVELFPGASHTITTQRTGLDFDWNESLHPGYVPLMARWIGEVLARPQGEYIPRDLTLPRPAEAFRDGQRWGRAPWVGTAWPQLGCLVLLPVGLLVMLRSDVRRIRRRRRDVRPATLAWLVMGATGSVLVLGFWVFVAQSLHPQGLAPMAGYEIPAWQRALPVLGTVVLLAAVTALLLSAGTVLRRHARPSWPARWALAVLLIVWCVHWQMVGAPL